MNAPFIKIHDKHQLEIKSNYLFDKDKSNSTYEVDTYIFIPKSLGINRHTYRKVNFYDSIKSYIRFKTPDFQLSKIADDFESPLKRLNDVHENLMRNFTETNFRKFEYRNKYFVSVTVHAIRSEAVKIVRRPMNFDDSITAFINTMDNVLNKYRTLGKNITGSKVSEKTLLEFNLGDEYVSLVKEKYLFHILDSLKEKLEQKENIAYKKLILKTIKEEIDYRLKQGYQSIVNENSDNEEFLYRFSAYKKYFGSILYLDSESSEEGVWLEQILFGVAAGFAMLFATSVAFYYQSVYGSLTSQLFAVLVISYIFKDRIKEIMRLIFSKKVLKGLYDFKIKVFFNEKFRIGTFKNRFDFIRWSEIPEDIITLRNKNRSKEFINKFAKEKVILFRQKIELNPNAHKKFLSEIESQGITDILRFNVSRLLTKMDDPQKPVYVLTEDGYKKVKSKRVYHVSLLIKFTGMNKTVINRYRLILNKRGILRVEKVA